MAHIPGNFKWIENSSGLNLCLKYFFILILPLLIYFILNLKWLDFLP